MAEKPPEEGYISVVDEEPEILELLKWDSSHTSHIQKVQEPRCETQSDRPKQKVAEKKGSRPQDTDPFDLTEPTFIETFRLSKDLARNLCEELKPVMPDTTKSIDCSVESKIMAAIAFFATGKYQKTICGKTDPSITQYFVSTAVIQVTEAMNHPSIVKKYIHFPHLREERDVVKAKFYMKYGVPNVLGCVECTQVPISRPDGDQKSHFNKSYHSKKVQIICDSDLTIISVDPSPGSHSHDGILSRHAVKVDLECLNHSGEPCWLIGSPYYSQKPYMMTPIPKITKKSPVSPEKYYNTIHSQTHSAVLETIKHLKSRWKCLQATCNKQFDTATVSMMIVACCVLHNMCNRRGLPICPMTQAEERLEAMKQKVANGPVSKKLNDDRDGAAARAQLVQRVWAERRAPPDAAAGKKRSKKDRILESQMSQQSLAHAQLEDAKRARLAHPAHPAHPAPHAHAAHPAPAPAPAPAYVMAPLPAAWGHHYPPHH